MKILIYFLCFFAYGIISVSIQNAGIVLGAIPTVLLILPFILIARAICSSIDRKRADEERAELEEQHKLNRIGKELDQMLSEKKFTHGEIVHLISTADTSAEWKKYLMSKYAK